jgi:lipoyl(octanoyl) transferase
VASFDVIDLGILGYAEAFEVQKQYVVEVQAGARQDALLLVQHPAVLTLGASFHAENLLHPADWYAEQGIEIFPTDRGGDVTFHGPGQLVAYPIFDVAKRGKDLHLWMRQLEESVIRALATEGLHAGRLDVNSGVWVNHRKVCAIGIKLKRWVSMHGIAVNCNIDLEPFSWFVPCGIRTHGVTSISRELGKEVAVEEFKQKLIAGFREVFDA